MVRRLRVTRGRPADSSSIGGPFNSSVTGPSASSAVSEVPDLADSLPSELRPAAQTWSDQANRTRKSTGIPPEVLEGMGFSLWGVLLGILVVVTLVLGESAILHGRQSPTEAAPWLVAVTLEVVGAWLAFSLASDLGWGTSEWPQD